jgi:2-polyprenyl-6-hydroxyphenyl methylase / 3-demethylubiquinone-9 3-methyltransferase
MKQVSSVATIDPDEAAHFGRLAADWWDPKGGSAMLHKLNPVRLAYIRQRVDQHWACDPRSLKPLAGRTALDVGCGAGLLCEPLARLGAAVTGVDAAPENVDVARAHASAQGLTITYHAGELAGLKGQFDLVTAMEVIEHVTDPARFVAELASHLAPGGLLILSTPNRTSLSKLAMITLGEGLGMIPKGTHEWNQFIAPERMAELFAGAGLHITDTCGISFSPARGLILSDDLQLNYLVSAIPD